LNKECPNGYVVTSALCEAISGFQAILWGIETWTLCGFVGENALLAMTWTRDFVIQLSVDPAIRSLRERTEPAGAFFA